VQTGGGTDENDFRSKPCKKSFKQLKGPSYQKDGQTGDRIVYLEVMPENLAIDVEELQKNLNIKALNGKVAPIDAMKDCFHCTICNAFDLKEMHITNTKKGFAIKNR